jgi:hypothetical protein
LSATACATTTAGPVGTGMLSGTVTYGGSGLSGVTVTIAGLSTTTGATGAYAITGVAPGTHTASYSKSGYWTTTTDVAVISGARATRDIAMVRDGTQPPPIDGQPTSITIKTTATTTYIGKTPILSGLVTPSSMIGVNIVVYVMKPGMSRWTYSSNRTVYTWHGSPASWQYKYYFKPGMPRGTYRFKARCPAPGFASSDGFDLSESPITTIRVK